MWSETEGCISFPHIHISIKIPHEGNKGFIIWYKYYSRRIALRLSSFFLFPFTEDIYSSSHKPLSCGLVFWLKSPILSFHFPAAPASYELPSPSALYDCVTDRLTLIVSPHPSVTLHQLSSDKPDQDKSLNKIWCPRTTKREKWESVRCSLPCHSKKKESAEIRSFLANEVKKDALLELLCGKGQSKRLQSVTRQKKKRCVAFLRKNECSKVLLQQFRRI